MSLASSLANSGILGEFRDQFPELPAGHFCLFLAQRRQCQQDIRKRPQIVAMVGGDPRLLDPHFSVAVDDSEPQEKLLDSRRTPDGVIRLTQAQIGIRRVLRDHQEFVGVRVGLANPFQAVELWLVDQADIVGLHTDAQSHCEEGVRIVRGRLQSKLRQLLRLLVRGEECRAQLQVWFQRDLAQKTLVVEEKLGGQHALPIALRKQIASRLRGAPKRVFRMALLPNFKLAASFLRL